MDLPLGKEDACYRAMLARDSRFDGKFFVGVKTTGIYCRPICPAKPLRRHAAFFPSAHLAQKAGYRPCLRCRHEAAPLSAAWLGASAVVQRALKLIRDKDALVSDEDSFAARFGVSARHLSRLFRDEIGKTPKQIAFENRLDLSRKLLVETSLPVAGADFAGLGTTGKRKEALAAFSAEVASGRLSLEPTQSPEEFQARLLAIPGIGRWPADYMALRVLGDADAFPATDLVLARALKVHPKESIAGVSPCRGYAAILLWGEHTVAPVRIRRKTK